MAAHILTGYDWRIHSVWDADCIRFTWKRPVLSSSQATADVFDTPSDVRFIRELRAISGPLTRRLRTYHAFSGWREGHIITNLLSDERPKLIQ
jgi:hypothetical protein